MNDLRLLLENLSNEVSDLIWTASFEAEKLSDLLKPWQVKSVENPPEEIAVPCEQSNVEQKIQYDVEKVNDVLRRARLIRQQQDSHVNETVKTCKTSSSKARLKKQNPQPSASTSKQQDHKEKSDATCSSFSKFKRPVSIRSAKSSTCLTSNKTSRSQNHVAKSSLPKSATIIPSCDDQSSHKFKYLQLEDVIKERSLPTKYLKLRKMHSKLKKCSISSSSWSTCCKSEKSFILNLINSSQSSCEILDESKNVFAASTIDELMLTPAIDTCAAYTNALKYKLPLTDQDNSPVALYINKLAYSKVTEAISDFESFYAQLNNTFVPQLSVPEHSQKLLSFKNFSCNRLPCSYLIYERESDVIRNSSYIEEIKWLQLNRSLKRQVHDVFVTELKRILSEQLKYKKVDKALLRFLSVTFGLLTKPNRCSLNPAIVLPAEDLV